MDNSITHPRIVLSSIPHQFIWKKSIFVIALAVFGAGSILGGILDAILSLNTTLLASGSLMWFEIIYQLSLGVFILTSVKVFTKGKLLSVWLYGSSILIDSIYHVIMSHSLNFLFIGFGLLLIWQIFQHKRELELM